MSHFIHDTIFDNSADDQNSLFTRRDSIFLNSINSYIQSEPGIVLDIILDDEHPLFKNGKMGKIKFPDEFPSNYKNEPPSNAQDYFSIGSVLVRLCHSQQKTQKEDLVWATPMDNSFSTFPLLNEIVSVVKYLDKYYYTNKINSKNFCNSSADFRYEQTYGKNIGNRSYSGVELKGPVSKFYSSSPVTGFSGILGNYFWFNNKIRNLRRFEGDSIFESRFGQSIRMGAYTEDRSLDRGYYNDYKSDSSLYGGGNPMILIRNRQRNIAKDTTQKLHPLLTDIPSISEKEKNVGGYISEDVNNDGSSIHITSGLTISPFKSTCYKSIFSSTKGATTFKFPVLSGDQIVIHSDRLVFASRFCETLHFSKKRYAIVTDSEFTVDSHDQIVISTNKKTVINSPAIFLGEYDNTNEPALLGQTTVNWLYDLCNWLLEHVHHYQHSHPDAGNAVPDKTQLPVQVQSLIKMRDRLHYLMSRRVFITGGGFAPGLNGESITDGVTPVKIDTISGNGVPGNWNGKNKR